MSVVGGSMCWTRQRICTQVEVNEPQVRPGRGQQLLREKAAEIETHLAEIKRLQVSPDRRVLHYITCSANLGPKLS